MAEQKKKPKPSKDKDSAEDAGQKTAQKKTEEVDELLDEIDEVLETNAEDFVRAYIQKGGQGIIPLAFLGINSWVALIFLVAVLLWRWRTVHAR